MKILMVSSEMAPLAKTGGLGDVLDSLSRALAERGHDVRVVLPRYGWIDAAREGFVRLPPVLEVSLGANVHYGAVWWRRDPSGLQVFLLEHDGLYGRASLYGEGGRDYGDNDIRFAFLSRGALALARRLRWWPDVLHAHDWQAAPAVWAASREARGLIRTVFTIHNLGYQGMFGPESISRAGFDNTIWQPWGGEHFGALNFLKAAAVAADHITTVSPRYALEIQTEEQGFGLDGLLRARSRQLTGILNGVDYRIWDPRIDVYLPARYDADDLYGKRACKAELLREFGLDPSDLDAPVVGVVSRLAWQKGLDLLLESSALWLAGTNARLVVLGAGGGSLADGFRALRHFYPGRVGARFETNERMAHLVEAGADIFAMPSRYEPCGLNQIYSLRYGTVPVVRATGGLDDTVEEADIAGGRGTGFKFRALSPDALGGALRRALWHYGRRDAWVALMRRGMQRDFSWARAAGRYEDVYRSVGADDEVWLPI